MMYNSASTSHYGAEVIHRFPVVSKDCHFMDSNITSIFDLSPAEKLQLVEDLWDDLAASPEAVPVHDWQKEELARRKANLASKPGAGLCWEEVKRRVRSRYGR